MWLVFLAKEQTSGRLHFPVDVANFDQTIVTFSLSIYETKT